MTIDALPGKARRSKSTSPEALPIGETDANIFDCPSCRRPLGVGTRRCPGCRTRLLSGTRAVTVLGYAVAGLLVGALVGGGLVGAAWALTPAVPALAEGPVATSAPLASALAQPTVAPVAPPAVPPAAISALRQSAELNQRLVTDAARLSTALAGEPSAADLARILRSLAANASFGDRLPPALASWSAAAPLSTGLAEVYVAVGAIAGEALDHSLSDRRAYVDAARRMIALIADVEALDAEARAVAATVDVDLPPLTVPAP